MVNDLSILSVSIPKCQIKWQLEAAPQFDSSVFIFLEYLVSEVGFRDFRTLFKLFQAKIFFINMAQPYMVSNRESKHLQVTNI